MSISFLKQPGIDKSDYNRYVLMTDNILFGEDSNAITKLSYIETSGTQYVIIPYNTTTNTIIDIKYSPLLRAAGQCLLGGSNRSLALYASGLNGVAGRVGFDEKGILGSFDSISDSEIICQHGKATYNGVETVNSAISIDGQTQLVLCKNKHYSVDIGSIRFYSIDIYEGKQLIKRIIPVKDKNDTVCLYDRISKIFYYSEVGTLIPGKEV